MVSCNRSLCSEVKVPSFVCNYIDFDFKVFCASCRSESRLAEVLFDFCESKIHWIYIWIPFQITTHHSLCPDCNKMPSLPQGAFAACKIRAQMDRSETVAKMSTGEKQPEIGVVHNRKLTDWSPLKYNSKLMNAIWGSYNRYSPHNIKSNDFNKPNEVASAKQ